MGARKTSLSLDAQQWVHMILACILALLIFLGVLSVVLHMSDAQFIGSDELKQNVSELESYTAEAQMIATAAHKNTALKSYTAAYGASLQKATDSVAEKLQEHAHDRSLTPEIAETIRLAQRLSNRLEGQIIQPTDQLPNAATTQLFYNHLSNQLDKLDNDL